MKCSEFQQQGATGKGIPDKPTHSLCLRALRCSILLLFRPLLLLLLLSPLLPQLEVSSTLMRVSQLLLLVVRRKPPLQRRMLLPRHHRERTSLSRSSSSSRTIRLRSDNKPLLEGELGVQSLSLTAVSESPVSPLLVFLWTRARPILRSRLCFSSPSSAGV